MTWEKIDVPTPTVESPTWGHLQKTAERVIEVLGGPQEAAKKLSWESFYTLTILASLKLNKKHANAFVLGKQHIG